jgi:hypothetical protein
MPQTTPAYLSVTTVQASSTSLVSTFLFYRIESALGTLQVPWSGTIHKYVTPLLEARQVNGREHGVLLVVRLPVCCCKAVRKSHVRIAEMPRTIT